MSYSDNPRGQRQRALRGATQPPEDPAPPSEIPSPAPPVEPLPEPRAVRRLQEA